LEKLGDEKMVMVLGKEMKPSGAYVMKCPFEIPEWVRKSPKAMERFANHIAEGYKPNSRERW
jgi:hypothetical protein